MTRRSATAERTRRRPPPTGARRGPGALPVRRRRSARLNGRRSARPTGRRPVRSTGRRSLRSTGRRSLRSTGRRSLRSTGRRSLRPLRLVGVGAAGAATGLLARHRGTLVRAVDLVRHVPLGSAERAGWTLALKALRALDQADGVAGDTSIRIESLRDTGVVLHGPAGGAHVEAARHALLQVPGILDVRIVDPHETDAPRTTAPPVTGWPGEVSVEPEDLPRTAAGAEAPASGGPPSASTQHPREVTVPDDGGDEVADGQQPNRASTDAGGDPTFAPLDEHPDGQSPMENDLDRLPPDQRGTAEADSMPPGSPRRG